MGAWVTISRVPPPTGKTILVRFGASIFFAAYSKWADQWFMVCPGGHEEKIEPPSIWFCADAVEPDEEPIASESTFRKSNRPKQLSLALNDSSLLSR